MEMSSRAGGRPLGQFVRRAQATAPDRLAEVVADALAMIGGRDIILALIDYEQTTLHPLLGGEMRESNVIGEPVVGTMAGRCFTSQELVEAERPGGRRIWVPVTERSDRLGVLSLTLDTVDDDARRFCLEFGLQVGPTIAAASLYTDAYHLVRRRQNMDLSAEMQWNLLPPQSFQSEHVAVAGMIEPAYEVGGDAFDYAVNDGVLEFAILDAVGHNLRSSLLGALVIGAYRHGRRQGDGLLDTAEAIDGVVAKQFGEEAFTTALFGSLDGGSGGVTLLSAGHPSPLHLRKGHLLGEVECEPCLPLGMGGDRRLSHATLEPGDRLVCYTDGVVDARNDAGEEFGLRRLEDVVVREGAEGRGLLEVARRTVTAIAQHRTSGLEDDATLLFVGRR